MFILFPAAVVFIMDWVIKRKIQKRYDFEGHSMILNGRVRICKLYNPGAAMGFLKNHKKVLDMVTLSSILYILYQIPGMIKRGSRVEQAGMGLILGGALNNSYERILKKGVTDYINFPQLAGKLKHIVFNLSDFAILLGGFMIIARQLRNRKLWMR